MESSKRGRWALAVLTVFATMLAASATVWPDWRLRARLVYYAHLRGTPLIKEVPRTPVDCRTLVGPRTMVALTFGQSNAANFGRGRHVPGAGVYDMQGARCYIAADPLVGADGSGGSVWTRLGDRLRRDAAYERVVFIGLAVGNTEVARWTAGGDLHPSVLDALRDARAAGLEVTHLLWHQGERDAHLATSAETYARSLATMIGSLRHAGSQAPVFVALASYCYGRQSDEVRRGQAAVASSGGGVFLGPDTDLFTSRDERYDDCHLSAAGLQKVADAWAGALARPASAAAGRR